MSIWSNEHAKKPELGQWEKSGSDVREGFFGIIEGGAYWIGLRAIGEQGEGEREVVAEGGRS